MKAARATVAAISHGLTSGFHCPPLETSAAIARPIHKDVFRASLRSRTPIHAHIDFRGPCDGRGNHRNFNVQRNLIA